MTCTHLAQWARKLCAVRGAVSQKTSILMSPSVVCRVTDIFVGSSESKAELELYRNKFFLRHISPPAQTRGHNQP